MAKSLVIVESPTKAKTLKKYLGAGFTILASKGHIKDLPKKELGVDIENNFKPKYVVVKGRTKEIAEIKKNAKVATKIYLAPDPDREGEAIAWHIAEEIGRGQKQKIKRALFHEITKNKVLDAIKNPKDLDQNKYQSQIARRVLDRLVGYKISPLLWKKVKIGLSAGRVQSVAVRIIVDREKEIKDFKQVEYWSIEGLFKNKEDKNFPARLAKIDNKNAKINNEKEANDILDNLKDKEYIVSNITLKERQRHAAPPFITSTLQQEASRKLRFTAKKTMMIAQKLYEGMDVGDEGSVGLITYMRTDSVRVSNEAINGIRDHIVQKYGKDYAPLKPNFYKTKKRSQDAHEAIRPTVFEYEPDKIKKFLGTDAYNLYKLIWNRFCASQMSSQISDQTSVDILASKYLFRANGSVVKFDGFMKVYLEGKDDEQEESGEGILPKLEKDEKVKCEKLDPKQHFTQPPPRYTESTLIKTLEENGIGRPSTYATIISTILMKHYVKKEEGRLWPTELGILVTELLITSFPKILDIEFTATMEEELDEVEEGKLSYVDTLNDFYKHFKGDLEKAKKEMRDVKKDVEKTDIVCEKCGKIMVIKWGRHGKFLACEGYPDCKNSKDFKEDTKGKIKIVEEETTDEKCDKCGSPMLLKRGRFGKFLACKDYPKCKFTKSITTGVKCPKCKKDLAEKRTKTKRIFYGCSGYPNCKFATWDKPVTKECPQCKNPILVEKIKKDGKILKCIKEGCGYEEKE